MKLVIDLADLEEKEREREMKKSKVRFEFVRSRSCRDATWEGNVRRREVQTEQRKVAKGSQICSEDARG